MSRSIEVVVSARGETRVTTQGFAGASCREASQFLEAALGQRGRETLTTEFFHASVEQSLTTSAGGAPPPN